ncbi:MAG: hypothetical protein WBI80_01900 [Coprothermobacter proteolyticus]|nr:hypothetical protein [Coprothermobacter proteolyticus]ACI16889.2 hypothetical protein COPRO5265_1260 [Coprothermobacter proteolyticus DSM 5265]MBK6585797.1 hypothetical protein [Coprothermobacter sp.]MBP8983238.1 hypothetical protein [Coprothermobacter sp.]
MSETWGMVIAVFLSAIAGAVVFLWGVRKERELPKILSDQLVVKASDVVLKTLKKQSEATKKDLAGLLDGLVVGPFWSSRKLKITDPEKVLDIVLPLLVEEGKIEEIRRSGNTFYRLKKKS